MADSEWISACDQHPTIPGVYRRKSPDGAIGWQRWNGGYWEGWKLTLEDAVADYDPQNRIMSKTQDGWWQGQIDEEALNVTVDGN